MTLLFDIWCQCCLDQLDEVTEEEEDYTGHFSRKSGNSILTMLCERLRIRCHFKRKTFLDDSDITKADSILLGSWLCT